MLSTGCIVELNFHDRMLISTIGPILVMVAFRVTYAIALNRNRSSEEAIQYARLRHMSAVILVTFLVYSSVSSTLFQMFDCDHLDDGNNYLRADYTILCDSAKHKALRVYAGVMIVTYPVGIPALYSWLLFQSRGVLSDKNRRENDASVRPTSTLWQPYKPSRFYFEVVECARRVLLSGSALLVEDDSAAKVAATLMIAVVFLVLVEVLSPYDSRLDTWVSRAGHAVVCTSMYFALLLKVDVSHERQTSQRAFEAILVASHVAMISAVLIEIMFTAWSYVKQTDHREHGRTFCWVRTRTAPRPVESFELEVTVKIEEGKNMDAHKE